MTKFEFDVAYMNDGWYIVDRFGLRDGPYYDAKQAARAARRTSTETKIFRRIDRDLLTARRN